MKKTLFAAALLLAAVGSANALDLGAVAGGGINDAGKGFGGVTVGQKLGKFGLTAEYDRATAGSNNQNRYSLLGSYDVIKLGYVTVDAKIGASYLKNSVGSNGTVAVAGVGAELPLSPKLSVTADYRYQRGASDFRAYNSNIVLAGLKYSF